MDDLKHMAASFFFCRAIISKVFLQKLEIKFPSSGGGLPPGVPCSLKLAVVGRECNERLDYFRKQQGRGAVKDGIKLRNKSKKNDWKCQSVEVAADTRIPECQEASRAGEFSFSDREHLRKPGLLARAPVFSVGSWEQTPGKLLTCWSRCVEQLWKRGTGRMPSAPWMLDAAESLACAVASGKGVNVKTECIFRQFLFFTPSNPALQIPAQHWTN